MSLRARLIVALMALLALGMAVYGFGTYQAFARAELQRLDDELRSTVPLVAHELTGGRFGRTRPGPVVVAPGTFARLLAPDGTPQVTIQVADSSVRPDLSAVELRDVEALQTVPSAGGGTDWRVALEPLGDGRLIVVAVPLAGVQQALDRLVFIETVAGVGLLALLAIGAWLILRSGLHPLERIAATARSISSGSLDQRVEVADAPGTEVAELATALNDMLDELEDAFAERAATEARLRRFLADASHELRTPLTSIQGFAELFRLGPDAEHVDTPTILRRIEEEADRMRRLVEDLLTLARLDETRPLERRPVDLAVLAADACSDAIALDPGRLVRLDAPAPVAVTGDATHLRQAIGNLVVNAIRHTPPGTPVDVAATNVDGEAIVTVRDHGDGLDEEAVERVFDRFWQADPARAGVGTGLGLSIVAAVATEHGGRVHAANAPDGGAVFTVVLPATGGSPPPPPPPPLPPRSEAQR